MSFILEAVFKITKGWFALCAVLSLARQSLSLLYSLLFLAVTGFRRIKRIFWAENSGLKVSFYGIWSEVTLSKIIANMCILNKMSVFLLSFTTWVLYVPIWIHPCWQTKWKALLLIDCFRPRNKSAWSTQYIWWFLY